MDGAPVGFPSLGELLTGAARCLDLRLVRCVAFAPPVGFPNVRQMYGIDREKHKGTAWHEIMAI